LETQGFAAAGGHDRQDILALDDSLNDLLLAGAKPVKPEYISKKRGSACHPVS
jgi:hypothetical protein